MDSSFTDAEKRFVLAEMIKVSQIDVGQLVEFVKANNVQPEWLMMQLPGGRNMSQCIRAAENMFNLHLQPPPIAPLKRKSLGDLGESVPKRLAIMNPIEPHALSGPTHVNIQPRPSPNAANGYTTFPSTSSPTLSTPGTGRKRGRPSKAEKEAQARANASHGGPYPPMTLAPLAPQPPPSTSSEPGSMYEPRPINFQPYGYQKKKTREKKPKSPPRTAERPLPPDLSNLVEHDGASQRQTPALREGERVPSPAASHMAAAAVSATDG